MKSMLNVLVKNEREAGDDHHESYAADDIDMIISKKDGSLVVVPQRDGVHCCAYCMEQFIEEPANPLRPVEFNPGGHGTRVMIHSKCAEASSKAIRSQKTGGHTDGGKVFWDSFAGRLIDRHQARRLFTRATKPFQKDAK